MVFHLFLNLICQNNFNSLLFLTKSPEINNFSGVTPPPRGSGGRLEEPTEGEASPAFRPSYRRDVTKPVVGDNDDVKIMRRP